MPRAVTCVLLLVLLAGCHSKRARYAGSGAVMVAGLAAFAIAPPKETCVYSEDLFDLSGEFCDLGQSFRALLQIAGVLFLTSGAIGLAVTASSPPSSSRGEDHTITLDRISERVAAQAAIAARAGDCDRVRRLVERIDLTLRATVLVEDAVVARCMR